MGVKRKREEQSSQTERMGSESPGTELWTRGQVIDEGDGEGGLPDWALSVLVSECSSDPRFHRVAASPTSEDVVHTEHRGPNAHCKLLAIDCEMVEVDNERSAVGRISVIERLQAGRGSGKAIVRLDEYVNPAGTVTNYRTDVSGLTPSHIELARLSEESARNELLSMLKANDVLVGHTLSADMQALGIAHSNVLDSALLFAVDGVTSFILSLKDAVLSVMPDHPGALTFQLHNAAHDSVLDALWALRLAILEARKVEHELPRTPKLESVPDRFMAQLAVKSLPQQTDENALRELLTKCGAQLPKSASVRAIRQHRDRSSAMIDLDSARNADAVFQAISDTAWPDDEGFLCKCLGTSSDGVETMLKSSRRVSREVKMSGTISRSVLGKVIGRKGAKLREIRRRSGALVIIKPPSDPQADTVQTVHVMAGERKAADSAYAMLSSAAKGERLPASQQHERAAASQGVASALSAVQSPSSVHSAE